MADPIEPPGAEARRLIEEYWKARLDYVRLPKWKRWRGTEEVKRASDALYEATLTGVRTLRSRKGAS